MFYIQFAAWGKNKMKNFQVEIFSIFVPFHAEKLIKWIRKPPRPFEISINFFVRFRFTRLYRASLQFNENAIVKQYFMSRKLNFP